MRTGDVPRLDLDQRALGLAVEESLYDLFRATATLPGVSFLSATGSGCITRSP